jgi:hypothetical protein
MVSEELVAMLSDKNPAARKRALDTAATTPDPDHLALLIQAISDRSSTVRVHARQLLKSLTGRDYAFSRDQWQTWWRENAHLSCSVCDRPLYGQKLYYRVKADITSEPREVIITEDDLAGDTQAKIDEIAEAIRDVPPEELQDEVWVRLEYYLCTKCKTQYVRSVRKKTAATFTSSIGWPSKRTSGSRAVLALS